MRSPRNVIMVALAVSLFVLIPHVSRAQAVDLTGAWRDENGITYCMKQIGNKLFWNMDDRPRVHNVFYGLVTESYVAGEWADLPGGQQTGSGTLTMRIESNDRFVKIDQSAEYLGSVWTRAQEAECSASPVVAMPEPPPEPVDEMAGSWVIAGSDPYQRSEYLWQVIPREPGVWDIRSTLLYTSHPAHKSSECKTFTGMTLTLLPSDQYEYRYEGMDPNPANPGKYEGSVILTLDKQTGLLSGQGEHRGTTITHWIRFEGKRGTDSRCQ
jgi:hypothetical protein